MDSVFRQGKTSGWCLANTERKMDGDRKTEIAYTRQNGLHPLLCSFNSLARHLMMTMGSGLHVNFHPNIKNNPYANLSNS